MASSSQTVDPIVQYVTQRQKDINQIRRQLTRVNQILTHGVYDRALVLRKIRILQRYACYFGDPNNPYEEDEYFRHIMRIIRRFQNKLDILAC